MVNTTELWLGIIFSILNIVVFVKRKPVAKFFKEIFYGFGSERFWEIYLIIFAPIGLFFTIRMIFGALK